MTVQNGTMRLCEACSRIFADGSLDTYSVKRDLKAPLPPHILELTIVPGSLNVCEVTGLLPDGKPFTVRRDLDLYRGLGSYVRRAKEDVDLIESLRTVCEQPELSPAFRYHRRTKADETIQLRLTGSILLASLLKHGRVDEQLKLKVVCTVPPSGDTADVRVYTVPLGVFVHHGDRESFARSLAGGCALCRDVSLIRPEHDGVATWFAIRRKHAPERGLKDQYWLQLGRPGEMSWYGLGKGNKPKETLRSSRGYGAFPFIIKQRSQSKYNIQLAAENARSTDNTGSRESLLLAASWMTECLSSHRNCAKLDDVGWRPTRLLELSGTTARLVHSSKQGLSKPYATLSHCWGESPRRFLLTSSTLDKLETGVPFDAFDSTFRDAFLVAKSLQLDLIWIDCFCIFQGGDCTSTKDWEQESANMHKIYANAVLNIGGTHGEDSRAGLFSRRTMESEPPWQHFARWRPSLDVDEALFDIHSPGLGRKLSWDLKTKKYPLFSRAWIVQERLLASRMLHFAEGYLFWECAELRQAPEWLPHESAPLLSGAIGPGDLSYRKAWETTSYFSSGWSNILIQYTRSSLTYPDKDKMVALGGLGRRVAELSNDSYHNGYLQKDLPHCLYWYGTYYRSISNGQVGGVSVDWSEDPYLFPGEPSFSGVRPFQMPVLLRAPSWHWSSTDHELSCGNKAMLKKKPADYPLLWLFPSHGPFAERLRRDTILFCLGKAIAVSCYGNKHRPLMTHLRLAGQYDEDEELGDSRLAFRCDCTDLATVAQENKFPLFLLPLTASVTVTGSDKLGEKICDRTLLCHLMGRPDPFNCETKTKQRRLDFTALVLMEIEKGIFARVGAYETKYEQQIVMLVRAMRRTPARLVSIR